MKFASFGINEGDEAGDEGAFYGGAETADCCPEDRPSVRLSKRPTDPEQRRQRKRRRRRHRRFVAFQQTNHPQHPFFSASASASPYSTAAVTMTAPPPSPLQPHHPQQYYTSDLYLVFHSIRHPLQLKFSNVTPSMKAKTTGTTGCLAPPHQRLLRSMWMMMMIMGEEEQQTTRWFTEKA